MLKPTGISRAAFLAPSRSLSPSKPFPQDALKAESAPTADSVELSSSTPPERPTHIEGEILVKTRSSLFKSQLDSLVKSLGASVAETFEFPEDLFKSFDGEVMRLNLPQGTSTEDALKKLADDPRVDYAVANQLFYLDEVQGEGEPSEFHPPSEGEVDGRKPNDMDLKLWGLHNRGQHGGTDDADIDAPEAWMTKRGSDDVTVAVIDTGVDYNHTDLATNMWTNPGEIPGDGIDNDGNGVIDDVHGYNAFADNGDPMDGHSHGTHVAGTIAAQGHNNHGITGVAWNASVMAVKIFDDSGRTSADAIIRGILYAAKNGARITNNSWGGGRENQLIKEAFETGSAFHVMAAGNNGSNNDKKAHYPSNYDIRNSVAVAATDRNDRLASFSNYGQKTVDLAAPGVQIYSTLPGGGFGNKSGTSMASPHVAGAAVVLVAQNPEISNDELKARLLNGAERLDSLSGKVATNGRLNLNNALETDNVAPSAITEMEARVEGPGSVALSFVAPGDDWNGGQVSSYEIRSAEQPITTLEQFESATPVQLARSKQEAGELETLRIPITASSQDRELHFAVQAFDNVRNGSPLAPVSVQVAGADLTFEANASQGLAGWQAEGSWGIETTPQGDRISDSPAGKYEPHASASLTSPVLDLSQNQGTVLTFDAQHKIEPGRDNVYLEVANADGEEQTWEKVATFTGESNWGKRQLDLSAYDGQQVQVRFHTAKNELFWRREGSASAC